MKSVGIWIRVSTEDQAKGESPEHHEKRARLYAEAKGWEVVTVYRLEAVSGKAVMEHPEAQRMLAAVRKGTITGLIFSKLARLARNTKELLEFADFFRDHEADLISLGESIDTTSAAGRLFYTMIAAMAQWEREEIAARVSASVPIRAKLGKPLGGKAVYGYMWKDGRFVVNPDEAPIRKLMYELFAEHRRTKTIARVLNDRGFRTRGGSGWTQSSIKRLLRDPSAKGLRRANYTTMHANQKSIVLKPEHEWVLSEVEPIVSNDLWNQVNGILASQQNPKKRPAKKAVHLFAGRAICSCGEKMYVKTSNKSRYVCVSCANKIPSVDLEAVFREQLKAFAVSPQEVRAHLEAASTLVKEKDELISVVLTERNKITKQQNTLIDLYQDGKLTKADFGDRYTPLGNRLLEIDDELPALEASRDILKINALSQEEVITAASDLYSQWPDLPSEDRRVIIESVVDRIVVGKDEIDFALLVNTGRKMAVKGHRNPHASSISA